MDRNPLMSDAPGSERAAAESDHARVAVRLSSDYFLRSLQLIREMSWGDLMTGVVALAITQGNVGHLDRSPTPDSPYANLRDVPPDELRRPVSVLSIASTVGLPYETTRRHVAKLIKAGICVRVKGGVIIPSRVFETDTDREQLARNLVNLRRLFRDLKAAGVDLD
jgi:hypothetical protein